MSDLLPGPEVTIGRPPRTADEMAADVDRRQHAHNDAALLTLAEQLAR